MPSLTAVTTGGVTLPLDLVGAAIDQLSTAPRPAAAGKGTAAAAAKTTAPKTTAAAKSTTAAKPTSAAKKTTTTAKTTAAKKTTTTKATGYATKLPADYAFLRDPKLSIEEKLSRFIGLAMTRSEQDLQAQMEKMAPGSTPATSASGTTATTAAKPKSTKVSLWGLAKTLLPPLNLASQLVGGDAKLKALVTQVSGPVLAAAATAVGLPMLAPLATKYGPTLVGALTKDISIDLAALGGGTSSSSTSSAATSSSTTAKAGAADGATSEKAQLMELQRLQDRDKELFSLFSNMLKSLHDSRMTCIQNLR